LTGDIVRSWTSIPKEPIGVLDRAESYARVVSIDDTHVTLERYSTRRGFGETITVERANLTLDDQEYVSWRLEAEKNPVDAPKPEVVQD
jgi:hypothetical protein